jgi:hypothetical protein
VVPIGTSSAAVASGQIPPLAFIEPTGGIPGTPEEFLRAADALHPVLEALMRGAGVQYLWMQPAFNANVTCREKHLRTADDWRHARSRGAGRASRSAPSAPPSIDVGELYVSLQNRTRCTLANSRFALGQRLGVAPFVAVRLPSNVVPHREPTQFDRLSPADAYS